LLAFDGERALFADDLASSTAEAERDMRRMLARIDGHIHETYSAWELPASDVTADLELPPAPTSLDLRAAGISTVVWATGYGRRYDWLDLPVLGNDGEIVQRVGVTRVRGFYTLGLRFQRKRKSHFIGGVGEDARLLAARIVAEQRGRVREPFRRMLARVGPGSVTAPGHVRLGPAGVPA
jgi:putative flavoprotein involved in K+ transport